MDNGRMTEIERQLEQTMTSFVGSLQRLMLEATIKALDRVIGPEKKQRLQKGKPTPARSPEIIAEITETLYRAICQKPGEPMMTFGKQLGLSSSQLRLPVSRLIDGGRVKKVGQGYMTRYFPIGPTAPIKRKQLSARTGS